MNAHHRDNKRLGILFITISSFCLALMSMLVKKLGHLPIMEIMFFQNLPAMIIMPIILMKMGIPIFGNNKPFLLINGFIRRIVGSNLYYCRRIVGSNLYY